MQKFLKNEQIICRSPNECLKEAFKFGIVKDDPRWQNAIEDRNLTSHIYDEENADDVYSRLQNYIEIFDYLEQKLERIFEKNK